MNIKLFPVLLALCISFISFSQTKDKIKGSKVVSHVITEIDAFERLVVQEDLKIKMVQGTEASVEIIADDNLHDVIEFSVLEGSLIFKTTKRITSKKTLEITVVYTKDLNTIELKENANISSDATLRVDNLTLKTSESASAFLTLKTDLFKFINTDKSKSELNITASVATLELSDNSKVKALINAGTIEIDMYQSSDAKIEGHAELLELRVDNSSTYKGENLTATSCTLKTEGRADVYVEATKDITIDASGSTETYLFGDPKIVMERFSDTAILRKK